MKRLVLAGAGHAHALVLRELSRAPLPGVEVVVVSPEPLAPYSGMVPGWLAGLYRFEDIVVDFPPLARAAGARWVQGEIHAVDPERQQVALTDGTRLDYDALSLNVGSTLRPPETQHAVMLALRPLSALRRRFDALLARWMDGAATQPFRVAAVGGGAAGVEGLLGVLHRLRSLRPDRVVHGSLISSSTDVLPGLPALARLAARRALDRAGVEVHTGSHWNEVADCGSDVVLWATGAEAHEWQRDPSRRGALSVDDSGFVRIDVQLRSVSHPQVFAVGDCASWCGRALPKAGVHAVRMGPTLAHNLRVALGAPGALAAHHPQRQFLVLLSTGDGRAIAARAPFGTWGAWAWAWRWKDRIDRRFIDRFHASSLTTPAAAVSAARTGDST